MSTTKSNILRSPVGRLVYPHILKPQRNEQDTKDVYSLSLNVPKDKDSKGKLRFPAKLKEMEDFLAETCRKKWGDSWSDDVELPFRDGDSDKTLKKREYNHGCICIAMRSYDQQPGLGIIQPNGSVRDAEPHELKDYFYAGARVICSYNAYTFDTGKKRGVSVGLRTVVFVGHGEKLTVSASASTDFDGVSMGDYAKELYEDGEDEEDEEDDNEY